MYLTNKIEQIINELTKLNVQFNNIEEHFHNIVVQLANTMVSF